MRVKVFVISACTIEASDEQTAEAVVANGECQLETVDVIGVAIDG